MADEARVLDALGDHTRRAVLELLRGGERSVRELTDATGVSQPAVSQHLRVLREAGLVTVRPEGTRRLHRVDLDGLADLRAWEPPHRILFTWHPGREEDDASEVEGRFAPDGGGTRVELEHRGWEAFGESAIARRRGYVGPGAWGHVLDHFTDGAEDRPESVNLSVLDAAYAAFFAEAERGGFGPPPDGEWDAAQVLAHVALNDLAMSAVAHAFVQGRRELSFANEVCQDREVLDAFVRDAGDLSELVARGRSISEVARAATARLDRSRLATPVHCRMLHDGTVVLEEPVHWGRIAVHTQATRHLPAHTGQLRDLRT